METKTKDFWVFVETNEDGAAKNAGLEPSVFPLHPALLQSKCQGQIDSTHVKANASLTSEEEVEMPDGPSAYWERLDAYEEEASEELESKCGSIFFLPLIPSSLRVQLAVGLPPARFGAQHEAFTRYFMGRGAISFVYQKRPYTILIDNVACFPQSYAAAVTLLPSLQNETKALVLDIGDGKRRSFSRRPLSTTWSAGKRRAQGRRQWV